MSLPEDLALGWIRYFWSADHQIVWLGVEEEVSLELAPATVVVGRLDARGRDYKGTPFFAEHKTAGPRKRDGWKAEWRFNAQSLTYGLLAQARWSGISSFTVRVAFKTNPPTYDHCWYTYMDAELTMWRDELLSIAAEIRMWRNLGRAHWPLNPSNCLRYGAKYACSFLDVACSKQDWKGMPANAIAREPHLNIEAEVRRLHGGDPDLVILDATRIQEWMGCREKYRRMYEENVIAPPNQAIQVGQEFHTLIGEYYRSLMREQEAQHG